MFRRLFDKWDRKKTGTLDEKSFHRMLEDLDAPLTREVTSILTSFTLMAFVDVTLTLM